MKDYMKEAKLNFATEQLITSVAKPYLPKRVIFQKVSYDRILGNKVKEFSATNPTVPFHEVIDIIRPKADRQYLDDIARHMLNSNVEVEGDTSAGEMSGKENGMMMDEDQLNLDHDDVMKIVYCDRNNTSDIWADLKNNFDDCGSQT